MSQSTSKRVFQHFVSLDKFDTSIEKVMNTTRLLLKLDDQQRMIPALIGINVDYNKYPAAPQLIRAMLSKFRSLHSKHFVRFVTDTLWAIESNNADIFYTYDDEKDYHCDVIWNLKIISPCQFEINVVELDNTDRHAFLDELSHGIRRFVPAHLKDVCEARYSEIVGNFYIRTKNLIDAHHLIEDLHLVFIPNAKQTGFYPVMLYGMSYNDARRKGTMILRTFEFFKHTQYEILNRDVRVGDHFHSLLDLIQDNDKFGINPKRAMDTYALVESLFSVFSICKGYDNTPHDIVMFNRLQDEDRNVDVLRWSMETIHNVISNA